MTRPVRRPPAGRPRAPRPRGTLARKPTAVDRLVGRGLEALYNSLYPRLLGRWLRQRLEDDLRFEHSSVELGRCGGGLADLCIAHLSDLHAGHFMTEADLSRIFERVAREEPHLVLLGGDLIERNAEEILLLGKALSLLRPPLGIFAVPGNHEYSAEAELRLWRSFLEEPGVELLMNRGLRLEHHGETLWLAGVDDLTHGEPDLAAAVAGAREEEPVVLLSHHPDMFREAAWVGVDLTISGHTHGGQITLYGKTPLRQTRLGYWRGQFDVDGARLYVSRGAGTTRLPLRIQAPGEVSLIRLRPTRRTE